MNRIVAWLRSLWRALGWSALLWGSTLLPGQPGIPRDEPEDADGSDPAAGTTRKWIHGRIASARAVRKKNSRQMTAFPSDSPDTAGTVSLVARREVDEAGDE